ncbi:hypothetical protein CEXT_734501 [Caerostris extrusa]|uniref:Uncharacterized protein n=1 Tax=Caerostris extrusa TaxID=172846 RepID=A0AAV4Y1C8_CAEEX|nr:hypothetical protein CEXT_734501 [Caerostris extrusa]
MNKIVRALPDPTPTRQHSFLRTSLFAKCSFARPAPLPLRLTNQAKDDSGQREPVVPPPSRGGCCSHLYHWSYALQVSVWVSPLK